MKNKEAVACKIATIVCASAMIPLSIALAFIGEYDGAENWEFKSMPVAIENQSSFDKILGCWDTLRVIQLKDKEESQTIA